MKIPSIPAKILVALAFTDDPFEPDFRMVKGDELVLEQAAWFAEKVGASLTLFHALEGDDFSLPHHEQSCHELLRDRTRPLLEARVQQLKEKGIEASYRIDEGVPFQRLLSEAKLGDYHLVMTGFNRHEDNWQDFLFHGSTTRQLIRYCPIPVWATSPIQEKKLDRLLVSVDFSDVSKKTVRIADELAEVTGAEKILLHCARYPGLMSARRMPDADRAVAEYVESVRDKINEEIDQLLGNRRSEWKVLVKDSDVIVTVEEIANNHDVDLVIMGTVARTGLAGFLVGNTAEKILGELSANVWAIKPDGWKLQ